MTNRDWIWSSAIFAGCLVACGDSAATPNEPWSATMANTAAAAAAGSSAPTAIATPAATSVSAPQTTAPQNTAAAVSPTAAAAPAAAAPGAGDPAAAAAPAAGMPTAAMDAPMDTCQDRRVSYAKPCHNNPDPCGLKSGFPGDEYCLVPPKEGEGFQVHFGPTDYKNTAETAKYVIKSGEEFNNSVVAPVSLTEKKWFNRITVQMRPGSHHWINQVVAGKPEPKFYPDGSCGGATTIGMLGGGQNLIYDNPPGGVPAPENEGMGQSIEGDSSLCLNLHAYNFSDQDQLREIWMNFYFVAEEDVTQRGAPIGMIGGLALNVPPHTNKELTYSGTFGGAGRIIQLYGHRHAWTPRFAVWLNEDLIYDSWDWQESATFNYDSLSMNPMINTAAKTDGAANGLVEFKSGDKLKFSCFIENNSDKTLGFSNEVYDGEMCNLWGTTVGVGLTGQFL